MLKFVLHTHAPAGGDIDDFDTRRKLRVAQLHGVAPRRQREFLQGRTNTRSEEHTSEL